MYRKIQVDVDIILSPFEIAKSFMDLDADEQAQVLNIMASIPERDNWFRPLQFQIGAIAESKFLNEKGRRLMEIFGEYSETRKG